MLTFCTAFIKDFTGLEYNWINNFFIALNDNAANGGADLTFIINWIFIYLTIFSQYATQKGNSYYGYRSGAFTFYAMT
jgi:hypothetical protein